MDVGKATVASGDRFGEQRWRHLLGGKGPAHQGAGHTLLGQSACEVRSPDVLVHGEVARRNQIEGAHDVGLMEEHGAAVGRGLPARVERDDQLEGRGIDRRGTQQVVDALERTGELPVGVPDAHRSVSVDRRLHAIADVLPSPGQEQPDVTGLALGEGQALRGFEAVEAQVHEDRRGTFGSHRSGRPVVGGGVERVGGRRPRVAIAAATEQGHERVALGRR